MTTIVVGSDPRENFPFVPALADVYDCGGTTGVLLAAGGANYTRRSNYSVFATSLAEKGLIVAVVDRFNLTVAPTDLLTPLSLELAAKKLFDDYFLMGHSMGSVAVLAALNGVCPPVFCSEPARVVVNPRASIGYGVSIVDPNTNSSLPVSNAGRPFLAFDGAGDQLEPAFNLTLPRLPGAVAVEAQNLNHFSILDGNATQPGDIPSTDSWQRQISRIANISTAFFMSFFSPDICSRLDVADLFGDFTFCLVVPTLVVKVTPR